MRALIVTAVLALIATACGSGDMPDPPEAAPTYPGSDQPELVEHAETAKADLATELGVSEEDISIVLAEPVTWRNGALGCEQPGMSYTQALVEGYRVRLEHDGEPYWYHGEEGQPPFSCPEPTGPPGDAAGG